MREQTKRETSPSHAGSYIPFRNSLLARLLLLGVLPTTVVIVLLIGNGIRNGLNKFKEERIALLMVAAKEIAQELDVENTTVLDLATFLAKAKKTECTTSGQRHSTLSDLFWRQLLCWQVPMWTISQAAMDCNPSTLLFLRPFTTRRGDSPRTFFATGPKAM